MCVFNRFRFFQVIIVISVSFFLLTTFSLKGFCHDWVYLLKTENFTQYYKLSSTNKQTYTIKVWVKNELTYKGKTILLNKMDNIDKQKYCGIDNIFELRILNYKEWKYCISKITYYSKSGDVLFNNDYSNKWNDIISDSLNELLFNKIIKDYNIQR